jgi:hypothetical protein
MFGCVFELSSALTGIWGKNIAATEPELICRNLRLFTLFTELVINVTSTYQGLDWFFNYILAKILI